MKKEFNKYSHRLSAGAIKLVAADMAKNADAIKNGISYVPVAS